ncbi:hypothetical protein ADK70_31795 [Streptomyces rimosus subsp. pseudoverticillatus]|nr:hypothetical protein ADK70_31795 [Streptomyces rimosus subsp. pseudoverticillatus]
MSPITEGLCHQPEARAAARRASVNTWNARRAAVLAWCAERGYDGPAVGTALRREAKRAKQARRDKRKRAGGDCAGVPPFPEAEIERIWRA